MFPALTEELDDILYSLRPNFIFLGRRFNFLTLAQFLNKERRILRRTSDHKGLIPEKIQEGEHYLTQNYYRKQNCRAMSLININAKTKHQQIKFSNV